MDQPTFRTLRREELDIALSWAAAEGWNPGLHDADAFWAADPEGFYGMFLASQLIGTASIVSYSGQFGFVGLFIVRSDRRGQGFGTRFWEFFNQRLSDRLNPGAPVALDGVFTMQHYYARSGFVFSHRNLRLQGVGQRLAHDEVVDLTDLPFDQVVAFDARHFGVPRPDFLRFWIRSPAGRALGVSEGSRLVGLGVRSRLPLRLQNRPALHRTSRRRRNPLPRILRPCRRRTPLPRYSGYQS